MNDIPRPLQILTSFSTRYPKFWKQYRRFLEGRGRNLPNWPEWCYCPVAAAYAIISGGGNNRCTLEQSADVGIMAALAAWRVTKGIYRFDESLMESLLDTPLGGKLPHEILYRMPEWCVYIELPVDMAFGDDPIHGFFAHLEWDPGDERTELRLILDLNTAPVAIPLHLTGQTLEHAIAAFMDEAIFQEASRSPMTSEQLAAWQSGIGSAKDPLKDILSPLVSVLLYLCTENADISARAGDNPSSGERAKPDRRYAAKEPTTWETGFRVGAALRRGRAASGEPQGGHHASPRPHVRRAHWHTYWRGPRGSQEPVLQWLSPMLVGAQSGETIPTIRPVRDRGEDGSEE